MSSAEMSTCFGAMLYDIRQQRGMSIAQASSQIGISSGYLSELENCKRNVPRHQTVLKIAAGLGLNPSQQTKLIQLADVERSTDLFTKNLPSELRTLILSIRAHAPSLDLAATRSLHAHLESLSTQGNLLTGTERAYRGSA